MWIIDKNTRSLQAKTTDAPGTPLSFIASHKVLTTLPSTNDSTYLHEGTISNSYSDLVTASYTSNIKKDIIYVQVRNSDSINHTVTFSISESGSPHILFTCKLEPNWTVERCNGKDWVIYDENGLKKKDELDAVVDVITVTENILLGQVVNGDGSKADSSLITKRGLIIGVAKEDILNGFSGEIITEGEFENPAWSWVAGNLLYLNGTYLSTTPAVTGFVKKIGIAKSPTKIEIILEPSILL